MALTDNIVSAWHLDESSGDAIDSAGSNDGTLNGVTQGVTGKINDAYSFNGSSDYVTFGDIDIFTETDFTITCWVKADSSGNGTFFGEGNEVAPNNNRPLYKLFQNGANVGVQILELAGIRLNITGSETAFDDTWHMVTYAQEGSDWYLYIDNVLDTSGTMATRQTSSASETSIGAIHDGLSWSGHYDGEIDEVVIWNRKLTENEIIVSLWGGGNGSAYPFVYVAESLSIEYNNGTITKATLSATELSGSISYELTADGVNWESVTNNVSHTFVNQGTDLRWRATGVGGSVIDKIEVAIVH